MKKKGTILVIIIFLIMVSTGFVKVSSSLPKFIKNQSKIKISYNKKPFDLSFETDKYIIYINKKAINNISYSINSSFNNIVEGVSKTSKNIIEDSYEKINSTVDKFRQRR